MTPKQIEKLEIEALALRKIADSVLQQVQAAKKDAAPAQSGKGRKRKAVKVDRVASLTARILTGKRKPDARHK